MIVLMLPAKVKRDGKWVKVMVPNNSEDRVNKRIRGFSKKLNEGKLKMNLVND